MLIIAEGVETQEQYQWLADSGCQVVQGFFVAHPMLAEEALHFPAQFEVPGLKRG